MNADGVWQVLDEPWRVAFDEAWASWGAGCFGIGAVAVRDGQIVARGRNRILEQRSGAGVLADSTIAHAEMNVLGSLSWGQTDVTIYTTLEPCLMCAGALLQAGVPEVCFAANDPLFGGVAEALQALPYALRREPLVRVGPMDGPLARFGALLPLTFIAFWLVDTDVLEVNAKHDAEIVALARDLAETARLAEVAKRGGSTLDALEAVWDDLVR